MVRSEIIFSLLQDSCSTVAGLALVQAELSMILRGCQGLTPRNNLPDQMLPPSTELQVAA